jgi:hypothetical protein
VAVDLCDREDCMKPTWGDVLVTWVRPEDEGQLRIRLCEGHLDGLLTQTSRYLLADRS